ncbi:MAG: hypothetical protein NZ750_11520 [Anaerolineae bacterium]|nr:hypothetical protein [Anaerolineae bacterium]MDW8174005.1 hypothetical protein [Anaerolineae bacterium]
MMRQRIVLTVVMLLVALGALLVWLVGEGIRSAPLSVGQGGAAEDAAQPQALGHDLAFTSNADGDWDVYLLRAEDGTLLNLSDGPEGAHDYFPSWSLDGAQINFLGSRGAGGELVPTQVNADGTGLRTLSIVEAIFTLVRESRFDWDGNWSPGGERLLWSSLRDLNLELYIISSSAEFRIANATRLTNHGSRDWFGRWSPQGERIAFASDRNGNEDVFLWAEADGTIRQLTTSPWDEVRPVFSADGRRLVYVYDEEDSQLKTGQLNLYVLDTDSAQAEPSPFDGQVVVMDEVWSPDGRVVVFSRHENGRWRLYARSVAGGEAWPLTDGQGDALFPVWRP